MAKAFDDRLITLGINLGNGQTITYDQSFYIVATGTKYANPNLGECQVQIDNIDEKTRNFLLTETSPLKVPRSPKLVTLDVGRESYGTFRLFQGDVLASAPTQPPDIGLTLRSLTLGFMLGNPVILTQPATSNLSVISGQVAAQLGVTLDFRATDKQIDSYSFTGGALKQIQKLEDAGNVLAFIDNDTLVVMDNTGQRNPAAALVNSSTGMVGVPEVTETGVRVKQLINNQIRVGDAIQIESVINPAANGEYIIFRLLFQITSRDTPFYWIMEARSKQYALGFQ